jgi:hypothetical protein
VKEKLHASGGRHGKARKPPGVDQPAAAYLHARGLGVTPVRFERLVRHAVETLPATLLRADPAEDLTASEVRALLRGGLNASPVALRGEDPLAVTAAEYAALLKTSRTTAETARLLGVNESRIRQRLSSHPPTLLGFKVEGGWKVPAALFDGRCLVPGVERVVPELPANLHPVAFHRWFVTPSPDLEPPGNGGNLSPREWLRRGFSVEDVARLAASL